MYLIHHVNAVTHDYRADEIILFLVLGNNQSINQLINRLNNNDHSFILLLECTNVCGNYLCPRERQLWRRSSIASVKSLEVLNSEYGWLFLVFFRIWLIYRNIFIKRGDIHGSWYFLITYHKTTNYVNKMPTRNREA